jgi:CHAD domain-containing protein
MMRRFALEQLTGLLTRLAAEVENARSSRGEEAVHDLRVTIRRFGQGLRVFKQFVPHGHVRPIKKQLRHIMDLTGEVRNRDITLKLLEKSEITEPPVAIQRDREFAMRILASELERWQVEHEAARWRAGLELPSQ